MGWFHAGAALAATGLLVTSTGALAQDDARTLRNFTMSGSWTLDAGDDYCRLAAMFQNGEDTVSFALERNRAENVARLVVVGDAVRPYRRATTIGYAFSPSGEERDAPFIRADLDDGQPYFNLGLVAFAPAGPPVFPPPIYDREAEQAFAGGVTSVTLDDGLQTPIRIQTGNLRAPIAALQACTDDLLLTWGLDFAAHQSMTRRATPVGPAYEWLSSATFGFQDFPLFSGGRNPFRVMVNAQGQPTSCHVHWASLSERKNASVCEQLMANARFEPALDAAGQPMASYWMGDSFALMQPFGRR